MKIKEGWIRAFVLYHDLDDLTLLDRIELVETINSRYGLIVKSPERVRFRRVIDKDVYRQIAGLLLKSGYSINNGWWSYGGKK